MSWSCRLMDKKGVLARRRFSRAAEVSVAERLNRMGRLGDGGKLPVMMRGSFGTGGGGSRGESKSEGRGGDRRRPCSIFLISRVPGNDSRGFVEEALLDVSDGLGVDADVVWLDEPKPNRLAMLFCLPTPFCNFFLSFWPLASLFDSINGLVKFLMLVVDGEQYKNRTKPSWIGSRRRKALHPELHIQVNCLEQTSIHRGLGDGFSALTRPEAMPRA